MGWKSTIDISRTEAKRLIIQKLVSLDGLTDKELAEMVEGLGYGDDTSLEYFGHNFIVMDDSEI